MAPSTTGPVRNYQLFGESAQMPEVVHCETIAARSVLHDWELAPHRHARLHQVLLIERGGGTAQLDDTSHRLKSMTLVNVHAGDIHAFAFTPGTRGWVVTMADELLDDVAEPGGDLRRTLARSLVLRADSGVAGLMRQIGDEAASHRDARRLVLRGLCIALLGRLARSIGERGSSGVSGGPDTHHGRLRAPAAQVLARFEALIEAHHKERWSVARYASTLGVSSTHLSRVARAATGEPASRWIEARVMREARRHLAFTTLNVATIAEALGFDDPAHFSRVFSRVVGVPPRLFRLQVGRTAPKTPPHRRVPMKASR